MKKKQLVNGTFIIEGKDEEQIDDIYQDIITKLFAAVNVYPGCECTMEVIDNEQV